MDELEDAFFNRGTSTEALTALSEQQDVDDDFEATVGRRRSPIVWGGCALGAVVAVVAALFEVRAPAPPPPLATTAVATAPALPVPPSPPAPAEPAATGGANRDAGTDALPAEDADTSDAQAADAAPSDALPSATSAELGAAPAVTAHAGNPP